MTFRPQHQVSRGQMETALTAVLIVLLVGMVSAQAQTFTVLYEFTGASDGAHPYRGSLLVDNKGNVYGAASGGGNTACNPSFGCGVLFKINSKARESVLYTFNGSPDGAEPYVTAIANPAGGGYAIAEYGGTGPCVRGLSGCGAIIKIDGTGKESVLYSFEGSPDGTYPQPGLVRDAAGNLYGTTELGGTFDDGTVFRIDPSGAETVLYSFAGSSDGEWPTGGLVRDKKGNLYGTTELGGADNVGTVFMLDSAGQETVMHSFGAGSDGAIPFAGLAHDAAGNLYGATQSGGAHNYGAVFTISRATGQESVLYSFAGAPGDGSSPYATLVVDAKGNLYGTTWNGGANDDGTVFKLDPAGDETLLHSFAGSDGRQIYGGLVLDAAGNLYGTALLGGINDNGTVFKLTP